MRPPVVLAVAVALFGCSSSAPSGDGARSTSSAVGAAPVHAALDFQVGWTTAQHGAIARGGHVDVSYAAARMSACAAPTIVQYARFDPGGQLFSSDEAFSFDVPSDATQVELWFHAVSPGCEQWDSSYGANWRFSVVAAAPAAVGWAGDWGSSTSRDCARAAGVPEPITIDEYMRERACIFVDADVWVPGVTDVASAHPEYVQARVDWSKDGKAATTEWLAYQGIVGHNARFRWQVPYEIRSMDDWSTVGYSFRFSTDGVNWTRVAQASGADRTLVRAFQLSP